MALTVGPSISIKGKQGDPGISFLVGDGAPSAAAVEGQGYIDDVAADLYKYTNGAWAKVKNLVGPMGLNGINGNLFAGTAVPDSTTYNGTGDAIYIRANGQVYLYDGDGARTWTDTGENLTGPQGIQGQAGLRGTQIYHGNGPFVSANYPNAAVGDMYFDDSASTYTFLQTA